MSSNNAAIVEIAQTAGQFNSSIVLQADNKYIDVKSILGLFTTLVPAKAMNYMFMAQMPRKPKKP